MRGSLRAATAAPTSIVDSRAIAASTSCPFVRLSRNGSVQAMASDIFAKIGDIKGESADDKHKGEIEVLSFSWGVNNSQSITGGAGGGAGKATFHDIVFSHGIDKASPSLLRACAVGEHIKEATITHRKAGKGQVEFLVIKMTDVIVTSVGLSDASGGSNAENVSLAFAKVDYAYTPQKADGSPDAAIHFKYDLKANKEG